MLNNLGHMVTTLQSDKGGEYISRNMNAYFKEQGIVHQYAYTSEQNGKAERLNRTLFGDFGVIISPLQLFGDNQGALKLLSNPLSNVRSKHIDIAHHFARERVIGGKFQLTTYLLTPWLRTSSRRLYLRKKSSCADPL